MAPPSNSNDRSEEPFVRITLKDVYAEVVQMRQEIAQFVPQVPDHEVRIRTVERWAYTLPPTFVMAVVSLIVAWRKS